MVVYSSTITLQTYFEHNRPLANGIGMIGYNLGGILGVALCEHLIWTYGWRGALLIMGGLALHRVPLTLTFRSPKYRKKQEPSPNDTSENAGGHCRRIVESVFDCSLVCHASLMLYLISEVFSKGFLIAFTQHLPNYAAYAELSSSVGTGLALIQWVTIVIRLITSFLVNSKYVNCVLLGAIGNAFGVASIVALHLIKNSHGLMTACILTGFCMGEYPVLSIICVG